MVAATIAPGCSGGNTLGTSSPVCTQGSDSVVVFQGPSGRCIPRARLVQYRCPGQAPQFVLDAGSARELRYLGGAFATRVPRLPEGSQVIGVGAGIQAVMVPDQEALYTVRGTETERWLALPDRDRVVGGGPRAFMMGDSILYGGQTDIVAALPGWSVVIDASDGRSSISGVAIAEAQATAGFDVVVVELGTNDLSVKPFRDHARAILASLQDVPLVLWQTVKGPVEVVETEEINAAIRELMSSHKNTAIADWAGSVKVEELSYDGVHPALGHEDAMAAIVSPMLRRWWSAVTADEAPDVESCGR
ncbi:MAG TPA: hypothetical protein VI341_05335 [Actinomycetota bacterium]